VPPTAVVLSNASTSRSSASTLSDMFKRQKTLSMPDTLLKGSILGYMPLGAMENRGLRFIVTQLNDPVSGCSRRTITRNLTTVYDEKVLLINSELGLIEAHKTALIDIVLSNILIGAVSTIHGQARRKIHT
jgi:hypothetical protein